ncbi:MAG: hypothetical protein JOZ43_09560 [Acidobacteriales bacterium]|nr:hypothetical protein [Terriglobales bacterium]
MWNTLKSYIWWTHPRGSLPYDVMVTLILAFIFISPHYIDFQDAPAPVAAHSTGRSYIVDRASLPQSDDDAILRKEFAHQLKSPASAIDHWEPLQDPSGNISAYRVFLKGK